MKFESIVKFLGLVLLLIGAYQAYLGYMQSAKLQTMRALHQQQMETCRELVERSSSLLSQNSVKEFSRAFDEFAKIKHGVALVFLDLDTIDRAVEVYNAALTPLSLDTDIGIRDSIRCSLGNSPFKLALACRNLLSEAYSNESGGSLSPLTEDYTIGWSGTCPSN